MVREDWRGGCGPLGAGLRLFWFVVVDPVASVVPVSL
jgi:hypothetical protein